MKSKIIIFILVFIFFAFFIAKLNQKAEVHIVSLVPESTPTPVPTIIASPTPVRCPTGTYPRIIVHDDWNGADVKCVKQEPRVLRGKASYYSRAGCLGCSKTLTMANGEPLDDSRLTVAYNDAPLNHVVTVRNMVTGKSVQAKVTDTGGFKRHGKIIDLTIATRDAIGCGSTCDVEVSL